MAQTPTDRFVHHTTPLHHCVKVDKDGNFPESVENLVDTWACWGLVQGLVREGW